MRLAVITVFIAFDLGTTVYRRFQEDKCDRISYTAHIAGIVTGLLMGIVILHNLEVLFLCKNVFKHI